MLDLYVRKYAMFHMAMKALAVVMMVLVSATFIFKISQESGREEAFKAEMAAAVEVTKKVEQENAAAAIAALEQEKAQIMQVAAETIVKERQAADAKAEAVKARALAAEAALLAERQKTVMDKVQETSFIQTVKGWFS